MQVVLAILANAGGVGKTTLGVHLAYEVSRRKRTVALLDLDPQRSLDVFCGLEGADVSSTIAQVLSKDFKGNWKLAPVWEDSGVEVCQGHPTVAEVANDLVIRKRGEYTLFDRLKKYPLPHDLVIIDCPATLGMLTVNALAAATHVLVPIQLEMKAIAGSAELVEWCVTTADELQLEPRPPILGFVPSMYDSKIAMHRQYLEQLPSITEQLEIKLFPAVRSSNEFKNASAYGIPLQKWRQLHPACKDFDQIASDVVKLIKQK
ncbi:cobyric acid synthase CobQ [Dulcicalothrix desertica PCC 7102]|uniref:Cobyric acid synthase CobQ n=1 Tax=Dulcicalothrix desertica PCC 7102 TaxID=232991 RepID=A0A3S1ALN1_9CYAN|nr:ParA family protein [Dulcicalothrix desertica]RUS94945.1 cobyric acid synthase CobQ [Dulcicalothrix desertica PCC 7102]TWH62821.1 chromosome partitioning protein [Dulcicalothrix desertica PCC 7102]